VKTARLRPIGSAGAGSSRSRRARPAAGAGVGILRRRPGGAAARSTTAGVGLRRAIIEPRNSPAPWFELLPEDHVFSAFNDALRAVIIDARNGAQADLSRRASADAPVV
jgi:hypothetical protein